MQERIGWVRQKERMNSGDQEMLHFAADDLLVDELNHRFYNCLQIISSASNGLIAQGGGTRTRSVRRFQDRISNIAEVHRILARPLCAPGIEASLIALCGAVARSFDRPDSCVTLHVAESESTATKRRLLLMLAAELLMNAFKHGPAGDDCRIDVRLDATPEAARLVVTNSFTAFERFPQPPRVASLLAGALGGVVDIRVGDRCEVAVAMLPLSAARTN